MAGIFEFVKSKHVIDGKLSLICCIGLLLLSAPCRANERENPSDITVGDYVLFGMYEQDNDETNGKEPIEWMILDMDDTHAFLLSRYAIEQGKYHYSEYDITWEKCTLREWLNDTFLYNAFTEAEIDMIRTTQVDNSDSQGSPDSIAGCENTLDKVFAISYAETMQYLPSEAERICKPTAYATATSGRDDNGARWWLRTPGSRADRADEVYIDGGCGGTGINVDANIFIRPALWVDTSAVTKSAVFSAESLMENTSSMGEALTLIDEARNLDEQLSLMNEFASLYGKELESGGWDVDLSYIFAKAVREELIPDLEDAVDIEDASEIMNGRKIMTLYDNKGDFCLLGDFYARLPETMRAVSEDEADVILYLVHSLQGRTDYIGSAYDRIYEIYLIDRRNQDVYRVYKERTTPPLSGTGVLSGKLVPMETLWGVIRSQISEILVAEYPEGTASFRTTGESCSMIALEGSFTEYEIPSEVDGYPVTGIEDVSNETLEVLTLPEGIVYITHICCPELRKINFPSTLKRITERAFYNVQNGGPIPIKIEEWNLNEGLEEIGDEAIVEAQGPINLPSTLKYAGDRFLHYGAGSPILIIPSGMTSLPDFFLSSPGRVLALYVPESVTDFGGNMIGYGVVPIYTPAGSAAQTWAQQKGYTVVECGSPEEMPEAWFGEEGDYLYGVLGDHAILMKYNGEDGDVIIPETLGGYPVTVIYWHAFYCNGGLQTIYFPDTVQELDNDAISGCNQIREISIPADTVLHDRSIIGMEEMNVIKRS